MAHPLGGEAMRIKQGLDRKEPGTVPGTQPVLSKWQLSEMSELEDIQLFGLPREEKEAQKGHRLGKMMAFP